MGQAFTFVLEMDSCWRGWELLLEVRRTFLVAGVERVFAAPQEEAFTSIWGSRSNHSIMGGCVCGALNQWWYSLSIYIASYIQLQRVQVCGVADWK